MLNTTRLRKGEHSIIFLKTLLPYQVSKFKRQKSLQFCSLPPLKFTFKQKFIQNSAPAQLNSLNHLLLHFTLYHCITLKLKQTLQVKSSPSLVQEKVYPSLVQLLTTRRRLAAYQVTSRSSLLLLLSSSSDSLLTLHVQSVSLQIWHFFSTNKSYEKVLFAPSDLLQGWKGIKKESKNFAGVNLHFIGLKEHCNPICC
jgi:hypothetical protein